MIHVAVTEDESTIGRKERTAGIGQRWAVEEGDYMESLDNMAQMTVLEVVGGGCVDDVF